MPVPFEDITLGPSQSRLLFLLLDGVPLNDMPRQLDITTISMRTKLSKLMAILMSSLPDNMTYYHLVAREFLAQQEAILRQQALPLSSATTPTVVNDAAIDAQFQFFARGPDEQVRKANA
jgi:hypothetical protein